MPGSHALRALAPAFFVMSLMAASLPASAQTLTGAAAQKSPQADVFIAYENALHRRRPRRRRQARGAVQGEGEPGDAEGLRRARLQADAGREAKARVPPEQRRKQIQKVEVKGDYAYLEAESERKGVLDVAGFEKTADGWKVAPVRR